MLQVWQDALDLTEASGIDDVHCFFHYTTELGFRNITEASKEVVEVFVLTSDCMSKSFKTSQQIDLFVCFVWHRFRHFGRHPWLRKVTKPTLGGAAAMPACIDDGVREECVAVAVLSQ